MHCFPGPAEADLLRKRTCGFQPRRECAYFAHVLQKYDDFVARPKLLALCESTSPALWTKSCPKVTLCQLQPCIKRTAPQTRKFLKSRTSICLGGPKVVWHDRATLSKRCRLIHSVCWGRMGPTSDKELFQPPRTCKWAAHLGAPWAW